ncbi:MAG: AtpZ/AtpI family protein [Dehalococcoidia bacterium]|nr:AtpZ/AtpI family protein [Dehalococcoidia bacterium]
MPDTPESLNTSSEESCSRHNDSPSSKGGWFATFVLLGRLGGIGWFVGITIALGAYGGYWLDKQFGTAPVLTVLGLALGLLTASVGMIRLLSSIRGDR